MTRPPLNLKSLAVQSVVEKLESLKLDDFISTSDTSNNQVSTIAANKIEAMQKFMLKPITKSGKYELEKDYYDSFSFLARRLDKDIQELASEYIFDALKKDLKKYNIPLMKNN